MDPSTLAPMTTGLYIMMGISLAAVAGLRAFLPLCVVAWLAHAKLLTLSAAYSWLGSDAAIIVFSVASVLEIAADKIPVVDVVLDHVADYIKPVAGTVLVSGLITRWDPLAATVFGLMAGGSISALFHQAKKLTRITSTGATLGLANPVISATEDLAGGIGILTAFFAPALAFTVVCLGGYAIYHGGRKVYIWFTSRPGQTGIAASPS